MTTYSFVEGNLGFFFTVMKIDSLMEGEARIGNDVIIKREDQQFMPYFII